LVVIGDGPARERLSAFAADLRTSSRVQFVGAVSDALLYRWLRTARVVVTLASEYSSGSLLTEALVAGVPVVASDLPIHRQIAEEFAGGHVIFVSPRGSPLGVADAIEEAARLPGSSYAGFAHHPVPSWEAAIDSTWRLYQLLVHGPSASDLDRAGGEVLDLMAQFNGDVTALGRRASRDVKSANGASPASAHHQFGLRVNGARRSP
jgi:glycosyltransferase involved in cell wall biosynthesis